MSVKARALIQAKFASASATDEYVCPASCRVIIDKFTATNTDGSARTLTIHIIPSSQLAAPGNIITSALSIDAGKSVDVPEMKNQILEAGDKIAVFGSVATKIVIRASGREVT